MTLLGTIVVVVAVVIGLGNGLRRGMLKEAMALVGVLLGIVLVTLWADPWGTALAQRTGWKTGTGQWVVSLGILWATALLTGYGSAALIPQITTRLTPLMRVGGAVVGLINWVLLVGWSLVATQTLFYYENSETHKATWIRSSPVSAFLLDRLSLIILGIAWTIAVLSLLTMLLRLSRSFLASPKRGSTSTASTSSTARPANSSASTASSTSAIPAMTTMRDPSPKPAPGMERSFLDKPQNPSGTPSSKS